VTGERGGEVTQAFFHSPGLPATLHPKQESHDNHMIDTLVPMLSPPSMQVWRKESSRGKKEPGIQHGEIDNFITMFQTDCGNLLQIGTVCSKH